MNTLLFSSSLNVLQDIINEIEKYISVSNFIYLLIGALLGTFIGAFVNFLVYLLKELINNKRISKSVKKLIDLENDKNKVLLKEFWEIVAKHENHWFENKEFNYVALSNAINDVPLPAISKKSWDNNFKILPTVYKSTQLENLWNIYDKYDLLIQTKDHLYFIENKFDNITQKIEGHSNQGQLGKMLGQIVKSQYFIKDLPSLSKKFKEVIESIIGIEAVKFTNRKPD